MVNIYEYFDFRKLLQDLFTNTKEEKPFFSHRYIAGKIGYKSSALYTKLVNGTARMSPHLIVEFAKLYGMNKNELRYFEALVHYNQAKTHNEKKHYFEQLLSIKQAKAKTLDGEQYELFSNWCFVAIAEIIEFSVFDGDFEALANMVQPAITPAQAKKAVKTLEKLGLVEKNPDGIYERTSKILSTGEEWKSVPITNFQIDTADLAKEAIHSTPRELRDVSTLTMSLSQETLKRMREKIAALRAELLQMAKEESSADAVYHMNFHLFPMSARVRGAGRK